MESTLNGLLLRDPSLGTLAPAMGNEAGPVLAVLFVRSGVGGVDRFPVRRTTAQLGRGPGNDVVLVAPSVSLEHAELRLRGGLWTLRDLGSTAGSLVDGVAVVERALLAPGSEVQLGEVRLAFDPQDRWEDSPAELAPVAAAVAPSPVRELYFRETATPFLMGPEPASPPRHVWFIAAAVVLAIVTLAYFLLQAR